MDDRNEGISDDELIDAMEFFNKTDNADMFLRFPKDRKRARLAWYDRKVSEGKQIHDETTEL
jgi:hypothetical protein